MRGIHADMGCCLASEGVGLWLVRCEKVVSTSRLVFASSSLFRRKHQDHHHLQAGRYQSSLYLSLDLSAPFSRLDPATKNPGPVISTPNTTMSPIIRSPVLSALARTKFQRPAIQQFRTYAAVRSASAGAAEGQAAWAAQWKKVGGSAMM